MSIFVMRDSRQSGAALRPESHARISSDDLLRLLELNGGEVIGSDEHGAFVRVEHRLLFIRRVTVVDSKDLRDALRAAAIGPGRFDIFLEQLTNR
jgi:hypothetical protein